MLFLLVLLAQQVLPVSSTSASPPVVQLDAWGSDSVRIRIAPPGGTITDPPFSPLLIPHPSHGSGEGATQTSPVRLASGNLLVTADALTGFITASRVSDGAPLFTTTSLLFGQPSNGSRAGSVSASITLAMSGGAGNVVLGLGEHRTGKLDATGYNKTLEESQYYTKSHGADIMIPFYSVHPLGLGLLWALPSFGAVSLSATEGHTWSSLATANIDLWITTTPTPTAAAAAAAVAQSDDPAASSPLAALLSNFVDAVGHATPMPSYVAGFWACKNRYRNQTQLLDVARGYKSRGLPLDIITVDYMHWVNFGDWKFNPQCWPDVPGMVQELTDMGVELAVTFWPYVTPAGAYYTNFSQSNLFATALNGQPMPVETWAGDMYLVDQTNPASRQAFYAAFKEGYGRHGVRTVWLDGSEPERATSDNFGEVRFQGGTDSEVGEAWVQQHVRAMAEGFAGDGFAPDEFFLLPRSTWAGASKYSAGVWSGDISSTFEELALQVRVAQQMAMSGHALWTNDGGGYGGGDLSDPTFQELIVRWMQASAFFPIMRLHGQRKGGPPDNECGNTGGDNEPWLLAQDPAHYAALAAVMQLRATLRDYTLGINRVAVRTGLPMVRPMILAFPGDAGCAGEDVSDQWMYGPDFLVGPVLESGAVSRSVYLPALGANATWVYHWNGSDAGGGGGRVSVDTSAIGDFPLFVRTPRPPPRTRLPLASLFSPSRAEVVTCASPQCYSEQGPNGDYSPLFTEGAVLDSSDPFVPSTTSGGSTTTYQTSPLVNYWSQVLGDNADSITGQPPGPTYTSAVIPNGYVLTTQAPGTLPLLLFTKVYNATHTDIAAFASQKGITWAGAQGYTASGAAGFVFEGM